jgi:hypothetical protein
VFETIAFLSTVAIAVIFVFLIKMDRAGRNDEREQSKP